MQTANTHAAMKAAEIEALQRLLKIAGGDGDDSRRAADFLLAWWNGAGLGHFDLSTCWGMSPSVCNDVVTVFGYIARCRHYPDILGLEPEFAAIIKTWRPEAV